MILGATKNGTHTVLIPGAGQFRFLIEIKLIVHDSKGLHAKQLSSKAGGDEDSASEGFFNREGRFY